MESSTATAIDKAIAWLDAEEHDDARRITDIDDPLVRVLIIPSRALHALWLIYSNLDQIVVVSAPRGVFDGLGRKLLDLADFQQLLRRESAIGAPNGAQAQGEAMVFRPSVQAKPAAHPADPDTRALKDFRKFIGVFVVLCFLWVGLAAGSTASLSIALRLLAGCGLLASAAFISGTVLGFVFGIPRSLASTSASIAQKAIPAALDRSSTPAPIISSVRPNTNLEQISDWLTKVLVGVGLTQLGKLGAYAQALAHTLGPSLEPLPHAGVMAVSICGAFSSVGFSWGYIESRTTLMRVFGDQDMGTLAAASTPPATSSSTQPSNTTAVSAVTPSSTSPATPPAAPADAALLGPTSRA
jgi:hypothetical protein